MIYIFDFIDHALRDVPTVFQLTSGGKASSVRIQSVEGEKWTQHP